MPVATHEHVIAKGWSQQASVGEGGQKRKGPSATPTIGPHAEFTDGGEVVQSAAVRAAGLGMDVGARVSFQRKSAKRDAGTRGAIVGFTQTVAIVKVDAESGDGDEVQAGIGALALVGVDEEDDRDGEVAADTGAGEASTPVDWELATVGDMDAVYNANVVIAVSRLHVGAGSDKSLVTVDDAGHVFATKQVQARGLTLVPATDTVASQAEKGRDHVVAHVSMPKSVETPLYICTPENGDRVVPHWLVRAQSQAADSGDVVNLDTFIVEVTAHNALAIKSPKYKDACKTQPIKIKIPVLSNPESIQAGSRLIVKPARGSKRKA